MYYYGELVRLRPPERSDLDQFVAWLSNPELRHYITVRYISDALEQRWFERLLESTSGGTPDQLHFVIETVEGTQADRKVSGTPIGVISLFSINWRDRCAEVGITIGDPACWGQGYGTDAMRVILDIGFNWYNLHRVDLHVVADNERAIRSYEKVGFRQEGKLREAVFVDGSYRDLLLMSILGREYQEGDKYD